MSIAKDINDLDELIRTYGWGYTHNGVEHKSYKFYVHKKIVYCIFGTIFQHLTPMNKNDQYLLIGVLSSCKTFLKFVNKNGTMADSAKRFKSYRNAIQIIRNI